ncbi:MAG TPA: hypothetical protein VJ307_10980, partial [Candidatus Deferrimicrobiaceae bacterium]|nr:hypothetical protein [Candidatus Deferrimicrobiaceae bacterium]
AEALSGADSVILAGVYGAEKFPLEDRLDPEEVVASLRGVGRNAEYIEKVDRIVTHLSGTSRAGDLILIMSNGGFGGIQGKLVRSLETRSIVPPVPGKPP